MLHPSTPGLVELTGKWLILWKSFWQTAALAFAKLQLENLVDSSICSMQRRHWQLHIDVIQERPRNVIETFNDLDWSGVGDMKSTSSAVHMLMVQSIVLCAIIYCRNNTLCAHPFASDTLDTSTDSAANMKGSHFGRQQKRAALLDGSANFDSQKFS